MASRIFLAGASRGVGRELADRLVGHSCQVTALLRSEAAADELRSIGVNLVMGDALVAEQIEAAVASNGFDAVISTVGGLPKDGQRSDYLGNKNLIDAAVKAGVRRFILVSSIGSGNSAAALPPQALQTLGAVLAEKAQAEQHLVASGLTYTVIRPGGLKSEPATGNGALTLDPTVAGSIHRADVADLVYRCLGSDRSHDQILSAVDRTLVYGQPDFEEFRLDE
ncbi:MAG: SDR family oxidoreductase [Microcoleus sp. SIO2G3]|nr:SDR family oxidoreductase [Microcoleus sp. SIO2G3]